MGSESVSGIVIVNGSAAFRENIQGGPRPQFDPSAGASVID
jgi:hypothetical protein